MAERFSSESQPGRLADIIAELVNRLRFSSTTPAFSSTASPSLIRLKVIARILEEFEADAPDLFKLGEAIISLADFLEEVPAASGRNLDLSLQRLVLFLESFFQGLDSGDELTVWLNHHRWLALQRSFANSSNSLAVFDELDDIIWQQGQQQDNTLTAKSAPEEMASRWAEVRRQGDLIFGMRNMEALQDYCVILLLDSQMSSHFLKEKLTSGGIEVIVADNPVSAWEIYQGQKGNSAVLCDQVAPSNHLLELRDLAEQSSPGVNIPLILVTMGDGSGKYSNVERARKLGARGVWRDPYELSDLYPCIMQDNKII